MIDISPGQGTYISNNEASFFIIPLSWSLFLNGSQIDSIVEVRNLMEVKAAYLAADCMNEENLGKLYAISHRLHNAYVEKDFKEFLNGVLRQSGDIQYDPDDQQSYAPYQWQRYGG